MLKYVLVTGGVETTGIYPIFVVNINAEIVYSNSAMNVDPSLD